MQRPRAARPVLCRDFDALCSIHVSSEHRLFPFEWFCHHNIVTIPLPPGNGERARELPSFLFHTVLYPNYNRTLAGFPAAADMQFSTSERLL